MKNLIAYLFLGSAAMYFIGCNADDGSTSGQTPGGNSGGVTPEVQMGFNRDFYFMDNTLNPPHQVFPVDNPGPVTVGVGIIGVSGYNAMRLQLVDLSSSPLRFEADVGREWEIVVGISQSDFGKVGLLDLVQVQQPVTATQEITLQAVNVVSQRQDGTYEISGERDLGRLVLDFYSRKSIVIELINGRTLTPSGVMTADYPRKYTTTIKDNLNFFITPAAVNMTSVFTGDRNLQFDEDGDGALDAEPILSQILPEFNNLRVLGLPDRLTIMNIKDIHTYFSLAANVFPDDKEMVITKIGDGLPEDESEVLIDDDGGNDKDEMVLAKLKPGSSQTYLITGNGPNGGFQFAHTKVTTKVNSRYIIQGVASELYPVAVVQEGDFAFKDDAHRDLVFALTASHEMYHSSFFKLAHISDQDNIMRPNWPGGTNLIKSQWDKIPR